MLPEIAAALSILLMFVAVRYMLKVKDRLFVYNNIPTDTKGQVGASPDAIRSEGDKGCCAQPPTEHVVSAVPEVIKVNEEYDCGYSVRENRNYQCNDGLLCDEITQKCKKTSTQQTCKDLGKNLIQNPNGQYSSDFNKYCFDSLNTCEDCCSDDGTNNLGEDCWTDTHQNQKDICCQTQVSQKGT